MSRAPALFSSNNPPTPIGQPIVGPVPGDLFIVQSGGTVSLYLAVSTNTYDTDNNLLVQWVQTYPTTGAANAISLQSQPVSDAAPTSDQVLQYVGGEWIPATLDISGNATELQGTPVSETAPTDGQVLKYSAEAAEYIPTSVSDSGNATELLGTPIKATAPVDGQGLVYNSDTGEYEPGDPTVQGL